MLNFSQWHCGILTWGWNYHSSGTEHPIIMLDLCNVTLADGGADAIFTAYTHVTGGAEKVTNEDTHTWIIWWSLSVIEIQVPVVRLERRKCNFPSERRSEERLCGFTSRKGWDSLMFWIYIKTGFLALLSGWMWCQRNAKTIYSVCKLNVIVFNKSMSVCRCVRHHGRAGS